MEIPIDHAVLVSSGKNEGLTQQPAAILGEPTGCVTVLSIKE